jgi:hypothetical protein
MSESKAPNPFECAKRLIGMNVVLKAADIVHAHPGVSLAGAERVLDRHASVIAAQMLRAGICAAVEIITREGPHHETPRD